MLTGEVALVPAILILCSCWQPAHISTQQCKDMIPASTSHEPAHLLMCQETRLIQLPDNLPCNKAQQFATPQCLTLSPPLRLQRSICTGPSLVVNFTTRRRRHQLPAPLAPLSTSPALITGLGGDNNWDRGEQPKPLRPGPIAQACEWETGHARLASRDSLTT